MKYIYLVVAVAVAVTLVTGCPAPAPKPSQQPAPWENAISMAFSADKGTVAWVEEPSGHTVYSDHRTVVRVMENGHEVDVQQPGGGAIYLHGLMFSAAGKVAAVDHGVAGDATCVIVWTRENGPQGPFYRWSCPQNEDFSRAASVEWRGEKVVVVERAPVRYD